MYCEIFFINTEYAIFYRFGCFSCKIFYLFGIFLRRGSGRQVRVCLFFSCQSS